MASYSHNNHPGRLLYQAAKSNKVDTVVKELKKGVLMDWIYRPWFDSAPLVAAVKAGSTECITILLVAKARLESRCRIGGTPLYWAARKNHPEILEMLIKRGANMNPKDLYDEGPLHVAAARGNIETSKVLIVNNANVNLQNKWGDTVLHLAAERGHFELVKVIMNPPYSKLFGMIKELLLQCVPYLNMFMAKEIAEYVSGHRINTAIRNDKGCTAQEVAKFKFNLNIAKYLARNQT